MHRKLVEIVHLALLAEIRTDAELVGQPLSEVCG